MDLNGNRLPIIEALIISSPEPITSRRISDLLDSTTPGQVDEIVDALNNKYQSNDASFRIRRIAGGYQLYILENYAGFVDELFTRRRSAKLSRAALETLAIIAYRQPVTKADIEMIRGVSSDSAINTLMQRKLITLAGRATTLGRPLLYATTVEFLKYFNLNSLEDLPRMEEIEELLASAEPDSQQSLSFEPREETEETDAEAETAEDAGVSAVAEESSEQPSEEDAELAELMDSAIDEAIARNIETEPDDEELAEDAEEVAAESEQVDEPPVSEREAEEEEALKG